MGRPKGSLGIPKYQIHKSSGQARVTIAGRDYYLGKAGTPTTSPESWQEYHRLISEYLARGKQGPEATQRETATVAQMVLAFTEARKSFYKGGAPAVFRYGLKWLVSHYGHTRAMDFGPLSLCALRKKMVGSTVHRGAGQGRVKDTGVKLTRRYINDMIKLIRLAFRWAAEQEIVPASVWHSLLAVRPLERGRSDARETVRVKPVESRDLEAVLKIASPTVAAMIRIQLFTGMRPGELVSMRMADIDMSASIWKYTPRDHKTAHLGQERVILIGPQAQEIIRAMAKPNITAPLFSPRQSWAEGMQRKAERGKFTRTRARRGGIGEPYVCQVKRRAGGDIPAWIKDQYTRRAYWNSVQHLCDRADKIAHKARPEVAANQRIIQRWHPHRLRHNAATLIRAEFGLDVAREILGHRSIGTTEIYAERDRRRAEQAMSAVG